MHNRHAVAVRARNVAGTEGEILLIESLLPGVEEEEEPEEECQLVNQEGKKLDKGSSLRKEEDEEEWFEVEGVCILLMLLF